MIKLAFEGIIYLLDKLCCRVVLSQGGGDLLLSGGSSNSWRVSFV